jgi:6-phosphogluconolactonase (cycloisomerase 2 family)
MKKIRNLVSVSATVIVILSACSKNKVEEDQFSLAGDQAISAGAAFNNEAGAVYVLSNALSGNQVLVYRRSANGELTWVGSVATGGKGTGAGLGSQGAAILHELNGRNYLFAVNAGSDEVSVLRQTGTNLTWVDKISSHGVNPISLTAHGNLLYVVNGGGAGNISGFHISSDGHLSYIKNSTRDLSTGNAGPAEISFNNEGSQLAVTEKNTNSISTFAVNRDGTAGSAIVHPSVGVTPFGFAFDNHDHLLASNAFGGAAGQSALTSFNLRNTGALSLIDGPKATHQTSACWLTITNNGQYCYVTNTGSGTISGYRITDGRLTLLNSDGVTAITGTTPGDVTLSANSKFLYNLNSTSHSITLFRVSKDGSLEPWGSVGGLPVGAVGIAAR